MRRPVGQKQYLEMVVLHFKVDGSDVTTTSDVNTGLDIGQHVATIKKGSGADSNLVTITLKRPLGMIPGVFFQERTLDCACRLEEEPTKQVIKVRTWDTDLTNKADDADFEMFLVGTEEIREGNY